MNAPTGEVLLSEVMGGGGVESREQRARETEHVAFTQGRAQQCFMLVVSLPVLAGL